MNIINTSLYTNSTNKMSNIFKTNSRFAALSEDIPPVKKEKREKSKDNKNISNNEEVKNEQKEEKINSFKDERPSSNFNSFKNDGYRERRYNSFASEKERQKIKEQREAEEKAEKELKKREEEKRIAESLKIENFPDLVIQNDSAKPQKEVLNFIETIKKEEKIIDTKDADPDLANLKPGWVMLKRDPATGNTIFKTHPEYKFPDSGYDYVNARRFKSEHEIGIDILNALVELHEKRTEEYIELYGYDTWEKMFKFPDWREREAEIEEDDEEEYDNYEEEYDDEY